VAARAGVRELVTQTIDVMAGFVPAIHDLGRRPKGRLFVRKRERAMAYDPLSKIPELISQGEKFTWQNFSSKSSYGYPDAYSDDWLVWTHHINQILPKIGQSTIANSIARGLGIELIGESEDNFTSARGLIVNGLKAAAKVFPSEIPASDRIVTLGHNSPEKVELLEKIDELVTAVRETNEFPGPPEEREQIIAELSAGRRLLEATRIRIQALKTVLQPQLNWLAEKAVGAIVGGLATKLLEYLVSLKLF
jgi:hypothetical protein